MNCLREASATVALRYEDREVLVVDLLDVPNRNLMDICSAHLGSLNPPVGWSVRDERGLLAARVSELAG
jgi:hypothetical protein